MSKPNRFGSALSHGNIFPNLFGRVFCGKVRSENGGTIMKKEKLDKAQILKMNFDRIIKEKNLKQKDVAARMICEPQTLAGHLKNPNVTDETIERIAEALEVEPKELLLSKEENTMLAYMKGRDEFFLKTTRGKLILFGSFLGTAAILFLYRDGVITMFASLIELFVIDVLVLPNNGKLSIPEKVLKIIFRVGEALMFIVIILYGILNRLVN